MKLEIGYNHSFEVRKEQYHFINGENFSILYLSDFHFNRFSEKITNKIIDTINELNPSIVLLGGDYVDSRKGLIHLESLLNALSKRDFVFAVAGNHDYYFGIKELEKIFDAYHIKWIEKKSFRFTLKNCSIKIDGNILETSDPKSDFSILCLHKPIAGKDFQNHYDLAFAGHLHGCQFVLWKSGEKLYPGKLFYKWNILKAKLNNCGYLISKGLGDTLPIRYNCKKDLIFVEVTATSNL